MANKFGVFFVPNKKNDLEYTIKDSFKLNIGKINAIILDRENKSCSLRLKFFKLDKEQLLKEVMVSLVDHFFEMEKFYKINLFVSEDIPIGAIASVGFELEGILENNLIVAGAHKSELIFGLDMFDYRMKTRRPASVHLIGKNIEVKNLTPENSQEMLEYYTRNIEHLKAFEPSRDGSFYTYAAHYSMLMESYKQLIEGSAFDLGIFKDNKIIGKIKLSNIVYGVFKNAFIGYSIDGEEQGRGYMKEAVELVVKYAFEELELHRVEASAMVDNIRSQRVLEACGFKEIGISEKYLFINGEWRDHKIFSVLNSSY